MLAGFIILVIAGSLGLAGYYYQQYQKVKNNPETIAKDEVALITRSMGKFMDLPTDEVPSIATVTDQSKVRSQEFFKKSKNGDKILIYTKAHKAILYRPSENRIIEFAPLAIQENQPTPEVIQGSALSVAIYNGSNKSGLTTEIENKMKPIQGLTIKVKGNAQKKDYKKSLIVDLTGVNQEKAAALAQFLGGSVGPLPEGEKQPNTDILIIATQ